MDKALTLEEINKITGRNSPMITYKDLQRFNDIYEVFKKLKSDNFLILYQSEEMFGHWCLCFIRPFTNNKEIEFYDSYGENINEHVDMMENYYKTIPGYRFYPHLSQLLINTPNIKIHYNNSPHQEYKQGIATCGRHCAWRLLHSFFDIDNYNDIFGEKNTDYLITELTNLFLD